MSDNKKEKEVTKRSMRCNNIGLIVLIVLLCLCAFASGLCIPIKSHIKYLQETSKPVSYETVTEVITESDENGTTECVTENVTIENIDVTDPTIQKALNRISSGLGHYCGIWDMYQKNGTYKPTTDMDNKLAFDITISNFILDGSELKEGETITKTDFDNKLASVFGKDYKFTEYENQRNCPSFVWSDEKQAWTIGGSNCGGTCGETNKKMIVKAHLADNYLTMYVRVLFVDSIDNNIKYYSDFAKTKDITNLLMINYDSKVAKEIPENFNKGALYKLVFEKQNSNYVFISSELLG